MNTMPVSEFKKLTVKQMLNILPIVLTADGKSFGVVIGQLKDVVVIGDLHPRVRNRFRAMEEKVRRGMPKTRELKSFDMIEE